MKLKKDLLREESTAREGSTARLEGMGDTIEVAKLSPRSRENHPGLLRKGREFREVIQKVHRVPFRFFGPCSRILKQTNVSLSAGVLIALSDAGG
jgi:hypothetical protein